MITFFHGGNIGTVSYTHLGLVLKDPSAVSEKSVVKKEMVSHRETEKGNLQLQGIKRDLISDGIFQEYLLDNFPGITGGGREGSLDYQLEYIPVSYTHLLTLCRFFSCNAKCALINDWQMDKFYSRNSDFRLIQALRICPEVYDSLKVILLCEYSAVFFCGARRCV